MCAPDVLVGEVRVDDAHSWVIEMRFEPVGVHQYAGIHVTALVGRGDIHRIRQFNSLPTGAARTRDFGEETSYALTRAENFSTGAG